MLEYLNNMRQISGRPHFLLELSQLIELNEKVQCGRRLILGLILSAGAPIVQKKVTLHIFGRHGRLRGGSWRPEAGQ